MAGHKLYGVIIQNCNISFSGTNAITIISDPISINNNNISESNGSAIWAWYSGITEVKNNNITNTALIKGAGGEYGDVAVSCYSMNGIITIEGNSIVNSGFNAIGFQSAYKNTIKNNYINTFNTKLDDGGAIGTGGANGIGTNITGNICINGIGNYEGTPRTGGMVVGIYLDDGSQNIEVAGNTVANCAWIGILLHNASINNVHDNISYNNGTQFRTADDDLGGDVANNLINNNQFISRLSSQTVCDFNSNQNNLLTIGTLDYNYYARPYDQKYIIKYYQPSTGSQKVTFEAWKTFIGQEAHSGKSPQAITSVNDLQFEYNETKVAKTVTLNQPMIDVKGTKYAGSVTLQPYTSVVLMKDYNPTTDVGDIVSYSQTIVYPNPNQGRFTIRFSELPAAGSRIEVLDLSGRKIVSRLITSSIEEFDLSGQAAGLYLVKSILDSEEKIHKLVIQN